MSKAGLTRKIALSLAIGAACLWLALRKVDFAEVGDALHRFDFRYLALAVLISLLIQVFRAWRWQIELSPLAELRFPLLWQVVSVAYMMINVMPFRLGEPVRPLLLSWKSELSIASIVGNWVFEKMMDAAAMVLFVHITLLVVSGLPEGAQAASWVSLSMFLLLLGLVTGFWLRGESFFDKTIGRVLTDSAANKARAVLVSAREGLQILPDKRLVAVVFAVTLALWFLPILSSYVLILGFGFDVPFEAAFVVFICIGAGTAIPNPPGMVGVFQVAAWAALSLFGVPKADAVAYGILLNALQFTTLVAQGLVALPFVNVNLGRLTREAVEHQPQGGQ